VTSRKPDDLDAFGAAIVEVFAKAEEDAGTEGDGTEGDAES